MHSSSMRVADQILADYERLEPGTADSWNPVGSDFELVYRLVLLHAATSALRLTQLPVGEFRVLDLGCGNGRSTRMYLDLGLHPDQLSGVDVRPGAVDLARRLNSAIQFDVYDGEDIPYPDGTFNWIHVSTVFSSIKEPGHRRQVVEQIRRKARSGGHVFYFDLVRANDFAGHDIIEPERLFDGFKVLHRHGYNSWRFMQELNARQYNRFYVNYSRLKALLLPVKPTHEGIVFEKK
jgi:SAM-dependent methyltransferase